VSVGLVDTTRRCWRPRATRWLACALAPVCLQVAAQAPGMPAGSAGSAPASASAPASEMQPDVRAWWARIQSAASNRNYQGTLVFSAGGLVSSSRVAHYCDGTQRYQRIDALDGQARQVLRHNELVKTLWPANRVAVVEPRQALSGFPALPSGEVNPATSYEARLLGHERIAGHDAQVLLFKPRDNLRFAQRLWAERSTGLLLRADVLDPRGEVLETSAFTDLHLGARLQPEAVVAGMKKLVGWKELRPQIGRTQLDAEGWTLAHPVVGFNLVSCVKRPLVADGNGDVQVLQSVFSDGLTQVSVFVEPFDAQRHQASLSRVGATHSVAAQAGAWWITVVGDVPMNTANQFIKALERKR
jgi:sigma-E factor negative regulatory protein RseB